MREPIMNYFLQKHRFGMLTGLESLDRNLAFGSVFPIFLLQIAVG
jgi:hypothetical protein